MKIPKLKVDLAPCTEGTYPVIAPDDPNEINLLTDWLPEIVHRCNCHDNLLEACEIMTGLCRVKYGNLDKKVYSEILKAEQVLAEAKKG